MKAHFRWFAGKVLIGTLSLAVAVTLSEPPKGWAMLAPAEAPKAAAGDAAAEQRDRETIQAALESKVVRQRLTELKLTPEQIDARMKQLSKAEVHQAATQIRTVNPGGDAITYVLVVGILVLLFVHLLRRV